MSVQNESIELHVERLEFEGLSVPELPRVQRAFERELQRLLAEHGLPARGAERADGERREATVLAASDLAHPERLGSSIARHVYAELGR
jgi:hypothetical protein